MPVSYLWLIYYTFIINCYKLYILMYVISLIEDEFNESLDSIQFVFFFFCVVFFKHDEVQLPLLKHGDFIGTLTEPTTCDNLPQFNPMACVMVHCTTPKMRTSLLVTNSTDSPSRDSNPTHCISGSTPAIGLFRNNNSRLPGHVMAPTFTEDMLETLSMSWCASYDLFFFFFFIFGSMTLWTLVQTASFFSDLMYSDLWPPSPIVAAVCGSLR